MSAVNNDAFTSTTRRVAFGLPGQVWLVQLGILINALGYGAVLPFEVIYLHEGRGFSLGMAGLVVGVLTGAAVVGAPVAGPMIDRWGARAVTAVGGVALALGYAGLAVATDPALAFAAAALAGLGNGMLIPSQQALLVALVRADLRHRVTAVSRVATNVGMGIGGAVGGVVAAAGLPGFVGLLLANALTYLVFVGLLLVVVQDVAVPKPVGGGYRAVLADRSFLALATVNVAMIAVGWSVFSWLLPAYARGTLGVDTRWLGVLLLANTMAVAVAQVPVARLAEGRRRMPTMAAGAGLFVAAYVLVLGAPAGAAMPLLTVAAVAIGVGECLHTTVLTPLTADLAPARLRGRYLAAMGLSFWLGLAVGPTSGGYLLGLSGQALFIGTALLAVVAGGSALVLERSLPGAVRLTPRPVLDGARS